MRSTRVVIEICGGSCSISRSCFEDLHSDYDYDDNNDGGGGDNDDDNYDDCYVMMIMIG
jgi:hypothetical protein